LGQAWGAIHMPSVGRVPGGPIAVHELVCRLLLVRPCAGMEGELVGLVCGERLAGRGRARYDGCAIGARCRRRVRLGGGYGVP
jgi:hypothetical protein